MLFHNNTLLPCSMRKTLAYFSLYNGVPERENVDFFFKKFHRFGPYIRSRLVELSIVVTAYFSD